MRVVSGLGKVLKWGALGLVVVLLLGVIYEQFMRATSHRAFPPPGEMVDVGGYSLHLHCSGRGTPTVLLESGLDPSGSLSWSRVQGPVSEFTRVCAYDRAGILWSESGPRPRDGRQIVAELDALLSNSGESPPLVLVGHSHGGLYTRLFTDEHPEDVAGLVMVDASHPEMMERLPDELARPPEMSRVLLAVFWLANHTGLSRLLLGSGTREAYPDSIMPVLGRFELQSAAAVLAEAEAVPGTDRAARETGPFGDLPLIVLVRGNEMDPAMMRISEEQARQLDALWLELQEELAELSTSGRLQVVSGADHYVQLDRPDVVIEAIREVVDSVRRSR